MINVGLEFRIGKAGNISKAILVSSDRVIFRSGYIRETKKKSKKDREASDTGRNSVRSITITVSITASDTTAKHV